MRLSQNLTAINQLTAQTTIVKYNKNTNNNEYKQDIYGINTHKILTTRNPNIASINFTPLTPLDDIISVGIGKRERVEKLMMAGLFDNAKDETHNLIVQSLYSFQLLPHLTPTVTINNENGEIGMIPQQKGLTVRRKGLPAIFPTHPCKSTTQMVIFKSNTSSSLIIDLETTFPNLDWSLIHCIRLRKFNGHTVKGEKVECKCQNSLLTFNHIIQCPLLADARKEAMDEVYKQLEEGGIWDGLCNTMHDVKIMQDKYPSLCDKLQKDYNVPLRTMEHIKNKNFDALCRVTGVIDIRKIIKFKKWRKPELADEYIKYFKEKTDTDFQPFSISKSFEELAKVALSIIHQQGITELLPAYRIDEYLQHLLNKNKIHHLHSPPNHTSSLLNTIHVLFTATLMSNIPTTLQYWLGKEHLWS